MKTTQLSVLQELALNILWFPTNVLNGALLAVVIPTQILLFLPSAHVGDAEQGTFLGWLTTVASLVALLMPPLIGSLSDRTPGKFGRRQPYIVAGGVLLVVSTPLLVMSSDLIMFLVGLSLKEAGKDLGLWSASATIPAIIAPLLGGIILTIANNFQAVDLGYRVIFLVASFFLIIAAISILFVREKRNVQKQDTHPQKSEAAAQDV